MRMRKKKNLAERLQAVSDYLFISEIDYTERNFTTAANEKEFIDFSAWGKQADFATLSPEDKVVWKELASTLRGSID